MNDPVYRASRFKRFAARHLATHTLPMTVAAINFQKPEPVGVPVKIDGELTNATGIPDYMAGEEFESVPNED